MRRLTALIVTLVLVPAGAPHEKDSFQLIGTLLSQDGKPFTGVAPLIFLQGAVTPFSARTLAARDGTFKFKKLRAAVYTLIVAVPREGEIRKTVEVGPSFADSKNQVSVTVSFETTHSSERNQSVSAIELSVPEEAKVEYTRADDSLSRRDVDGAVAHLKKAIKIAPQFAAAWNHLGTIAYQSRQYAQAEEYFREALNRDPGLYNPLVNLGGALLSLGKYEESLPINQRAARIRPDDALAHSQLGQSYFHLGDLENAERHLRQAKALDLSHFSLPQVILAELYLRRGQLPAAIAEMEEFLKLHPDSNLVPSIRKTLEAARASLTPKPSK